VKFRKKQRKNAPNLPRLRKTMPNSYDRLVKGIESQAAKAGIAIEEIKQPIKGSPQDQAKQTVVFDGE
jgi:hypothetical protein